MTKTNNTYRTALTTLANAPVGSRLYDKQSGKYGSYSDAHVVVKVARSKWASEGYAAVTTKQLASGLVSSFQGVVKVSEGSYRTTQA